MIKAQHEGKYRYHSICKFDKHCALDIFTFDNGKKNTCKQNKDKQGWGKSYKNRLKLLIIAVS